MYNNNSTKIQEPSNLDDCFISNQRGNGNPYNLIPNELMLKIFSYLNMRQIFKLGLVDRRFYELTNNPYLPCFNWIFRSQIIEKKEEEKQNPDIIFTEGKYPRIPETSYPIVMKEYVKHIHSKEYNDMLKNPSISNEDIIEKLNLAADQGSERALMTLLLAYRDGNFDLDPKDPKVQEEGLRLTEHYANQSRGIAIITLLQAHKSGKFGINRHDPLVQTKGFELTLTYAKNGFEGAIGLLLGVMKFGGFGINAYDPSIQKKGRRFARSFSNQGSETAIRHLLEAYHYGQLGLNKENSSVKKKKFDLAYFYSLKGSKTAFASLMSFYRDKNERKNLTILEHLSHKTRLIDLIKQMHKNGNISMDDLEELVDNLF